MRDIIQVWQLFFGCKNSLFSSSCLLHFINNFRIVENIWYMCSKRQRLPLAWECSCETSGSEIIRLHKNRNIELECLKQKLWNGKLQSTLISLADMRVKKVRLAVCGIILMILIASLYYSEQLRCFFVPCPDIISIQGPDTYAEMLSGM